jgi:cell division protein FtsW
MNRLFARTDQSVLGRWWWTVDRGMLAAVMTLVICGVVLVTAASPPVAIRIGLNQYYFIRHHLMVLIPALAMMFGISLLPPRSIWRLSCVVLLMGLIGMVLVLFVGMEIKGAQRWIHLPGMSIQPSEFVKPAFAVVAAWFMAKQKDRPEFPGNRIAAGLYLIVISLLLLQPDLGMTVVVTCIYGAQVFLAGFPLWLMGGLCIAAALGLVSAYFVFAHVHSRIDRFLDPAVGDNYQVAKALDAFREGGFFGMGPGQGVVKLSLPDAHADFIFAVAGDEMGFIFVAFLVVLFTFIVLRGFNRIMDSDDMFIVLAAGGLLVMFGLQALIHMGSSTHLLPAKGMTLPFVSYGGSSLLAVALAMGMILSLTRRHQRSGTTQGGSIAKGGLALGGT